MKPLLLFGALTLTACSATISSADVKTRVLTPQAPAPIESNSFAVSDQPGGSIQLRFKLNRSSQNDSPASGFKTQQACTIDSDLTHFRIFLIQSSTTLLGALGVLDGLVFGGAGNFTDINMAGLSSPTGTQQITLTNVPQGDFYVAISAYKGGTNITGVGTSFGTVSLSPAIVTSEGGSATAAGRVTIGPAGSNFPITDGTAALSLTLNLGLNLACL